MGKAPQSLMIISFILIGPLCFSQTSVTVSEPRLEMKDNIITISYDILNTSPEDSYTIAIEVKDEANNLIVAKSLTGDIGDDVSGGSNKKIFWDLEADQIIMDAYIIVQINAKANAPPVQVVVDPEDEPDEISKTEESSAEEATKTYNRTGLVLQSLALPGIGLSRVTGQPHWIRGVAGYGCIVGSIVLNRQAIKTFDTIGDMDYYDEINEAYNKSLNQDKVSEVLAYTAIGIWIVDIIWTLAGTRDLNKRAYGGGSKGFSLGSDYDALAQVPLITVRYRF